MKKLNVYRILLLLLLGSNLLLLLNSNSEYKNEDFVYNLKTMKLDASVINNDLTPESFIRTNGLILKINDSTYFGISNLGLYVHKINRDSIIYIDKFDKYE